jgi:hypothetical protein
MTPQDERQQFWHVWSMPMLLAVLIVCGLLSALLGTGVWHLLSWVALAFPVLVIVRFVGFPQQQQTAGERWLDRASAGPAGVLARLRRRRRPLA